MTNPPLQYISTTQLARFLGISVVAVNKRIKSGRIKADKIGRSYAIPRKYIEEHYPGYPPAAVAAQDTVSVMQAAALLNVDRKTVLNKIKRGELPAQRVGRHYVLPKSALQAPEAPAAPRAYVSTVELAALTGDSRKTIFRKIKEGKIKARRVGRHYVIARDDIPLAGFAAKKTASGAGDYLSVAEAAARLGISRIAVFKKIKKGQLRAERMGRSYAVLKAEVAVIEGKSKQ
ncbi:MAG: excisionase family DNA-binding protein [Candidatus Omnitrophica bacterium]|nr:excisionase family DNA-binding protein [Candidatus Omnitrophota bacterium]MCB9720079.1 excisionase family DNA-binding protein [Candidatus Omnitrophota bacterium]